MEIQMSVEVLCEECRNCPELELIDNQERTYKGLEYIKTTHQLRCKNLQRCESVKKYLLRGGEQLTMKEVEEYAGVDLMGDSGRPVPDICAQNQLKEEVDPCLKCIVKTSNCFCPEKEAWLIEMERVKLR